MRAIPIAIIVLAQMFPVAADGQMAQKDYERYLDETVTEAARLAERPPEVAPIIAAMKQRRFDQAESLSTKVIESARAMDESPQFESWVLSLAHLYRGTANWELRKDWKAAAVDIRQAAELGNVEASRVLLNAFKAVRSDKSALGGYQPTVEEEWKYTRLAGDLDSIDAIEALAKNETNLPADERLYWKGRLFSGRANLDRQLLLEFVARSGDGALDDVLAKHALVGRPYSGTGTLPGRDVLATLDAENNLHYKIVMSLAGRGRRDFDQGLKSRRSPTVLENFLFVGTTTSRGGLADLHLLVPGEVRERGRNIHEMPRGSVIAETRAGDTVNVSCGPLSHTATVFAIEPSKDELLLVDGLSEFWKPSHNSCVTYMDYKRYKYGFYLVALRLSEVAPMIDAIATVRSAEFIGREGDIGLTAPERRDGSLPCAEQNGDGSGAPNKRWEAWIQTDFMREFNLQKTQTLKTPLGTSVFYKVGKAEYFGNVGVIISVDTERCLRSVSMTIRRSLIDDSRLGIDANMMISAFLADSLNAAGAEQVSPLVGRIKKASDPKDKDSALEESRISQMKPELRKALAGEQSRYDETFSPDNLRVENIEAPNGASLVRLSVW